MLAATSPAHAQAINVSVDFATPVTASDELPCLKLLMVALNPDKDDYTQHQTIHAAVIVLHPKGGSLNSDLTSSVGTRGANKIASCADTIFAEIDEWSDVVRKAMKNRAPPPRRRSERVTTTQARRAGVTPGVIVKAPFAIDDKGGEAFDR